MFIKQWTKNRKRKCTSLLDNAPNYLVGCIIQKRFHISIALFFIFQHSVVLLLIAHTLYSVKFTPLCFLVKFNMIYVVFYHYFLLKNKVLAKRSWLIFFIGCAQSVFKMMCFFGVLVKFSGVQFYSQPSICHFLHTICYFQASSGSRDL